MAYTSDRTQATIPPKVSVIVATYYRNELLRDAIESVLDQAYSPLELIVVDDSGEGHAAPVLREYDEVIPIPRAQNGGWGAAYTSGIDAATGEYVHFLDDDYFLPGKLSKSVELLENDPEVGVGYSGLEQDDRGLEYPLPDANGDVTERALRFRMYPCTTVTMLMDRELLTEITPLPKLSAGNDLNLIIEPARRTEFDSVSECLVYRRAEESRMWESKGREWLREIVRGQRDLYDRYPSIRRSVFAERYEKDGRKLATEKAWSPKATVLFLKAVYYAEEERRLHASQAVASLLGRSGYTAARRLWNSVAGGTSTAGR